MLPPVALPASSALRSPNARLCSLCPAPNLSFLFLESFGRAGCLPLMGCRADPAAYSYGNANQSCGGSDLEISGHGDRRPEAFLPERRQTGDDWLSHSHFLQSGHMTGRLLSRKSRPLWTLSKGAVMDQKPPPPDLNYSAPPQPKRPLTHR